MKSNPSVVAYIAALVLASGSVAQATSITVDAVGTINGNARSIVEATGNSVDATTFASDIATAFSNNTGGVWNFEDASFTSLGDAGVAPGETITVNYGASLANSLTLTLGSTDRVNAANVAGEATSGSFGLGLGGDAGDRTFTSSVPLLTVGIFNTDRNDAARIPVLKVTFQDTTTASTSGANADNWFFHSISGTVSNPIVSFTLSQNAFVRYDDLGFITAIPEPASAATLVGLATIGFAALRRRRSKA